MTQIDSMIQWLDEHQHDGMAQSIREALEAEDPRTWREVFDAGLVDEMDVRKAWNEKFPHRSADNYPVTVGAKFWTNDLRVAEITEVGKWSNDYSDTGETSTWHQTSDGSFDTLTGFMRQYGRLARYFEGKDAENYPAGTNYAEVKGNGTPR